VPQIQIPKYTSEEALAYVLAYLRGNQRQEYSTFSPGSIYDLYIPDVVTYCSTEQQVAWRRQNPQGMVSFQIDTQTNAEPFYEAAWSLCTHNILRPGPVYPQRQFEHAPVIGAGFYLTSYGKVWLNNTTGFEVLPIEHNRFASLLANYSRHFGQRYHLRSQEAVSCYQAHTYLACCVMCGAASESILLSLAIARTGDEERVLKEYRTNTGRTKIERLLLSHANSYVQQELPNYINLLKYWRDDAAHGDDIKISESEAFTSLLLLLRFAQFAVDQWTHFTGQVLDRDAG
jgi:hypothetical protein